MKNKKELEKYLYSQLSLYRDHQARLWGLSGKKVYKDKDSFDFLEKVCNPTSDFVSFLLDNY